MYGFIFTCFVISQEAMQVLEDIQSCINKVTPEALKHLLQIPSVASQSDTHTIVLRKYLLPLKTDPILVLLTCDLQNNMPLKELFQKAEQEFSIEVSIISCCITIMVTKACVY